MSRYVAMGSSFGAGPGLRPRAGGSPRRAGRSAANYAHLVAGRTGLELADVTYSGATVAEILRGSQSAAVDGATSLVTITAGGNDVGYLPALTLAALPRPAGVFLRRRLAGLTDPAGRHERLLTLETDLRALVDRVHRVAPAARVLIVGYLTILPPTGVAAPPLPEGIADWGRSTADELARLMARVANDSGALFVDAGASSRDHHAWSAQPWTRRFHYSLRGGAPFHPNLAGMRQVAALIGEALEAGH